MKILVINPNTTQSMTDDIGHTARQLARSNTLIDCVSPRFGPRSIESFTEEAVSAVAMLEEVARHRDSYDAFVIACFGDPGLFAAREVSDVPVIGIAEAAMHLACLVAYKFSIIAVVPRTVPMLEDLVHRYGLDDRCASVRSAPISVLGLEEDWDRAEHLVMQQVRGALEEDGAEAICLGCAGLGSIRERVAYSSGVPVLDGVASAVKLAETLHDLGVRTAKVRAFLHPDPKEYQGNVVPSIAAFSNPVSLPTHAPRPLDMSGQEA